jgi:hypothetical protein
LSRGSDFAASVMPLLALVLMATIAGYGKLPHDQRTKEGLPDQARQPEVIQGRKRGRKPATPARHIYA